MYAYAIHPTTEIVCAAYSLDDDPVQLWQMGEPLPYDFLGCATMGNAEMHAWNANFERTMWRHCWSHPRGPVHTFACPPLERWHCTMAQAAIQGVPLDLDLGAKALHLVERKDEEGHKLMMKMNHPRSKPGKPVVWWDDPADLKRLGEYCMQDVRVEREAGQKLFAMRPKERQLYLLDQKINDTGMLLDVPVAAASLVIANAANGRANGDITRITEGVVKKPNQVKKLREWLSSRGCHADDLSADTVAILLSVEPEGPARDALVVRQDAARSSVKKLDTMLAYAQGDGRMRGMLQFAGAAHTGRWAGRGVQPQNFPRGTGLETEAAIPLVTTGEMENVEWYAAPLELLSNMLRCMMIAAPGRTLIAGDFAAIEARVLAWLAGQEDLLEIFRQGGDPYKAMASSIYSVPVAKITKTQRALGKMAVLALGYQMGAPTFQERCGMQGIAVSTEFAQDAVALYRRTNDRIHSLWGEMERAAMRAVRYPGNAIVCGTIRFICRETTLAMILPSGRSLYYYDVHIAPSPTPWGEMRDSVMVNTFYDTMNRWAMRPMYGGIWVENAVQAIARDILAESMLLLDAAGFPLVLTVHDEIVAEPPVEDAHRLGEFIELMSRVPPWADGCPIAVEAWEGQRYRK